MIVVVDVRLMQARPAPIPHGPGWVHEPKLDGCRLAVDISVETGVRAWTRSGREVTAMLPELAGLIDVVDDALLDGELIVLGADLRPDFHASAARTRTTSPAAIARAAREHPAAVVAFDLLRLDGRDLRGEAFAERRRLLEDLGLEGAAWQVIPQSDDAAMMAAVARAAGMEGVVSKRSGSKYLGGETGDWVKHRFAADVDMLVGGVRLTDHRVELLVGEESPAGLVYRGRVRVRGPGVDDLALLLKHLERAEPPFVTDVPLDHRRGAVWLNPDVAVEVRYTTLTPQGRMRGAQLTRVRLDK